MDAHVDQLCAWRTDAQGRSIRQLTRDIVMATLFAESEGARSGEPTGREQETQLERRPFRIGQLRADDGRHLASTRR